VILTVPNVKRWRDGLGRATTMLELFFHIKERLKKHNRNFSYLVAQELLCWVASDRMCIVHSEIFDYSFQ